MKRLTTVQQIYVRLDSLEKERIVTDIQDGRYIEINVEMDHLRGLLSKHLNSPCPLLKSIYE